jgi:hypothetical protein
MQQLSLALPPTLSSMLQLCYATTISTAITSVTANTAVANIATNGSAVLFHHHLRHHH